MPAPFETLMNFEETFTSKFNVTFNVQASYSLWILANRVRVVPSAETQPFKTSSQLIHNTTLSGDLGCICGG